MTATETAIKGALSRIEGALSNDLSPSSLEGALALLEDIADMLGAPLPAGDSGLISSPGSSASLVEPVDELSSEELEDWETEVEAPTEMGQMLRETEELGGALPTETPKPEETCDNVAAPSNSSGPIAFDFASREGTDNYANCNGVYTLDPGPLLNGKHIYTNPEKKRFIGWNGRTWTLTAMCYREKIFSGEIASPFGGFHFSSHGETLEESSWAHYLVTVRSTPAQDATVLGRDTPPVEEAAMDMTESLMADIAGAGGEIAAQLKELGFPAAATPFGAAAPEAAASEKSDSEDQDSEHQELARQLQAYAQKHFDNIIIDWKRVNTQGTFEEFMLDVFPENTNVDVDGHGRVELDPRVEGNDWRGRFESISSTDARHDIPEPPSAAAVSGVETAVGAVRAVLRGAAAVGEHVKRGLPELVQNLQPAVSSSCPLKADSQSAEAAGHSANTTECAYRSARGECHGRAEADSVFCMLHKCPHDGCPTAKRSTEKYCSEHTTCEDEDAACSFRSEDNHFWGRAEEDAEILRVSHDVSRIREELEAVEKLVLEIGLLDDKAIGRAIYDAKAVSNELMNLMLKLDGLTVSHGTQREQRKALIKAIHGFLDRADAAQDTLHSALDSLRMASSLDANREIVDGADGCNASGDVDGADGCNASGDGAERRSMAAELRSVDGEVAQFTIDCGASFAEVLSMVNRRLGLDTNEAALKLKFEDDEGELCSIDSDEELAEALCIAANMQPPVLHMQVGPAPSCKGFR